MSENLYDFLFESLMIVILITALSLFFAINARVKEANTVVKEQYLDDRAVYESNTEVVDTNYITGAELISQIYLGLEYDIEINGKYITSDINPHAFIYSIIDVKNYYMMLPRINTDGAIEYVSYIKRDG